MTAGLLRGRDHTALGSIGELADERAAAAISRGGALKSYAYTDANEDAALFCCGARGVLVAVADGHGGSDAAERVLVHLRDRRAREWSEGGGYDRDRWYHEIIGTLVELNDAVLTAQTPERRSRTTLALGLARPEEGLLVTASIGDSHVFRVGDAGAVDVGWPRARPSIFLGQGALTASTLAREARVEIASLAEVTAVAVVTDGFSERNIGVTDPETAVAAAVEAAGAVPSAERSGALARLLVEAALEAQRESGAGDSATASAMWLAR